MGRRLVIEADGGSRGNPGVAGYGALVRDAETGQILAERAEPLGTASNNVAEYTGLIAGLEAAEEIDPTAVIEARMDSKLVVEQMSGRWKIKHADMRRLALEAQQVARRITEAGGTVSFEWVPRAKNRAADALSNAAMDGRSINRRLGDETLADPDDPSEPAKPAGPTEPTALPTTHPDTLPDTEPSWEASEPADQGEADALAGVGCPDQPEQPDEPRAPEPPEPTISAGARPASAPARRRGADLGPGARIVLVRHGVTPDNRSGRLSGRGYPGLDLDPEGLRQARAVGSGLLDFLGLDCQAGGSQEARVVTSTLTRAVQTGAAIAALLGVGTEQEGAWDEQDYGSWEGRSMAELSFSEPDALDRLLRDPQVAFPDGESHEQVAQRAVDAFQALAAAGGTSIVVSHRVPLLAVLGHVLGADLEHAWRLAVAPGSLTSIRVWRDGAGIEFVNDTSHLRR